MSELSVGGALSGESSMIIAKLDRNFAKREPEGTFESPLHIVTEAMFTRGEKIATLKRWRQALENGVIAAREVDQRRVLAEIEEARDRLSV
jgi:hypothetical protein